MKVTDLNLEVLFDVIVREPQAFLDALPGVVDTIFDAAQHLSNSGRAELALRITDQLGQTLRVLEWQGPAVE